MIQIRNETFETNSSSSHSIVITYADSYHKNIDPDYHLNQDGIYRIYDSDSLDFERYPFDVLTSCWDKIRYAIAYYGEEKFEEINEICKKHIKGFKGIKLPNPSWYDGDEPYYGHVDHQSASLLGILLDEEDITLEQFLFDDRYIVIIDGDEYCTFDKFMQTGIINRNNIKKIVE